MLVWRNSLYRESGEHLGYEWFGTHEAAEKAAQANSSFFKDRRARIAQMFDTGHGKEKMIQFLNREAGHADNG